MNKCQYLLIRFEYGLISALGLKVASYTYEHTGEITPDQAQGLRLVARAADARLA
jgi:hypothetical protein